MPPKYTLREVVPSQEKTLKTLVENRQIFNLNHCELNIFETFLTSEMVALTFNDFVVTSMLRGKKVMHLEEHKCFDYLPGETVLVPANVTMHIDFPEANKENPTQCIALALDNAKIQKIVQRLNEDYPKQDCNNYWDLRYNEYHFNNNLDLAKSMNKIIDVATSQNREKDILMDLALREMVVHIIQNQNLSLATGKPADSKNALDYVVQFIRMNIAHQFHINELCRLACMSLPTFHRSFKKEYGMSPLEFILQEKIRKAKQLLSNPEITVTDVCYEVGFNSLNYFDRQFKRLEGITPKQYKSLIFGNKTN